MSHLANTFKVPYYAVIFASERTEGDNGHRVMASKMAELASQQKGYLGAESARGDDLGITVSYWERLKILLHGKTMQLTKSLKSVVKKNGIVVLHYVYVK